MFANAITVTGPTGTRQQHRARHGRGRRAQARRLRPGLGLVPLDGSDLRHRDDQTRAATTTRCSGSTPGRRSTLSPRSRSTTTRTGSTSRSTHVTSGTTYQIAADGYGGDSGALTRPGAADVPSRPSGGARARALGLRVGELGHRDRRRHRRRGHGVGHRQGGGTTVGTGTLDGTGHATVALPDDAVGPRPDGRLRRGRDLRRRQRQRDGERQQGDVDHVRHGSEEGQGQEGLRRPGHRGGFGGANTGTVQVYDGSKVIGTGTLASGTVKIHITKNLKCGKHTLTVKYLGSTNASASSDHGQGEGPEEEEAPSP